MQLKNKTISAKATIAMVLVLGFSGAALAEDTTQLPPVSPPPPVVTAPPQQYMQAPFNFQQFNIPQSNGQAPFTPTYQTPQNIPAIPMTGGAQPLAPFSSGDDADPFIRGKNLIRQATQLISIGQLDAAIGLLQKSMEWRRADPTPLFLLGLIYDQKGNTQAALTSYTAAVKKATALGMDSAQLRINLGNTLVKLNYVKEAEFDYKRAIEIDDKNDVAHLNLGRLLLFKGDSAGAFKELQRAHELMATDPNLPLYEALALKGMGNTQESRLQLQEFLERAKGVNSDPRVINMAEKLLAEMK